MKKVVFLFLLSFLPLLSQAKTIAFNDICYYLDEESQKATVIQSAFSGFSIIYSGDVVIPEEIVDEGVHYPVISISSYAFSSCTNLTSIFIPESVISIGSYAFSSCTSLTSIFIHKNVTSIGDNPFSCCNSLVSITVDSENTVYDSRDNCNAIIETQTNKLIQGCNSTIIPDGVTSISAFAFVDCIDLKSVTIPNSVTSIGKRAFQNCKSLSMVIIGSGVMSIGEYAFNACVNLKEVMCLPLEVPETDASAFTDATKATLYVPEESYTSYNATEPWKNFEEIEKLPSGTVPIDGVVYILVDKVKIAQVVKVLTIAEDFTIPETVNNNAKVYTVNGIQSDAFYGRTELKSVTIPNSVTTIGEKAFMSCSNLTDVSIGTGVKDIKSIAFANCKELTNVYCYAEEVPTTAYDAFANSFIEYANLYVPETAYNDYANTLPWSGFKSISKIKDNSITTGIENGQRNSVKGQRDEWFTLDGQKLSGKPSKKGVYIYNGKKVIR